MSRRARERASAGLPAPPKVEGGAMGWQPIETVPKDGTRVLLYREGWAEDRCVGWVSSDGAFVAVCGGHGFPGATHWAPLPEPPLQARSEAEGVFQPATMQEHRRCGCRGRRPGSRSFYCRACRGTGLSPPVGREEWEAAVDLLANLAWHHYWPWPVPDGRYGGADLDNCPGGDDAHASPGAELLDALARYGRVEIVHRAGRRVLARWKS